MSFISTEQIETEYAASIERAKGNLEVIADLRIEKAQALADFKLKQVADRERRVWIRDALHDYPNAKAFEELVKGETEEEIRTAAEKLHSRLDALVEEHFQKRRINEIVQAQLAAEQNHQEGEEDVQP